MNNPKIPKLKKTPIYESPSPSPLTPETQKYSIEKLCYAPVCKPLKNPNLNKLKKIKL